MSEPNFKLDRTITLSIVFAIFMQTAGALIWAGSAEARLAAVEQRVLEAPRLTERLARLEEQMIMARASLQRIEKRLDADD